MVLKSFYLCMANLHVLYVHMCIYVCTLASSASAYIYMYAADDGCIVYWMHVCVSWLWVGNKRHSIHYHCFAANFTDLSVNRDTISISKILYYLWANSCSHQWPNSIYLYLVLHYGRSIHVVIDDPIPCIYIEFRGSRNICRTHLILAVGLMHHKWSAATKRFNYY